MFHHDDVIQEAIVCPPWVALAVRPRPGVWEYIRVNVNDMIMEGLSVPEYLRFKEELVDGRYFLSAKLKVYIIRDVYSYYCNRFLW